MVIWELTGSSVERQRRTLRLIGVGFAALAVYLLVESTLVLATGFAHTIPRWASRGLPRPRPRCSRLPDGNVLDGTLDSVFAVDVTRAMGRCANCGATRARGTSRVYMQAAGTVVRSPSCGEIRRRLVNAPGRTFLDLRGLSFLQIAAPEGAMH